MQLCLMHRSKLYPFWAKSGKFLSLCWLECEYKRKRKLYSCLCTHSTYFISKNSFKLTFFPNHLQRTMHVSTESLIHSQVNKLVREECQCGFECSISLPDLVCDEEQPNEVLYKANIYIYGVFPPDQLMDCINKWITHKDTAKNALVIVGHEFSTGVNGTTQTQTAAALNASVTNSNDPILAITVPVTVLIVAGFIVALVLTCHWARYEVNSCNLHVYCITVLFFKIFLV